eukprot:2529058-Prymnesium_polylepis.1
MHFFSRRSLSSGIRVGWVCSRKPPPPDARSLSLTTSVVATQVPHTVARLHRPPSCSPRKPSCRSGSIHVKLGRGARPARPMAGSGPTT